MNFLHPTLRAFDLLESTQYLYSIAPVLMTKSQAKKLPSMEAQNALHYLCHVVVSLGMRAVDSLVVVSLGTMAVHCKIESPLQQYCT